MAGVVVVSRNTYLDWRGSDWTDVMRREMLLRKHGLKEIVVMLKRILLG